MKKITFFFLFLYFFSLFGNEKESLIIYTSNLWGELNPCGCSSDLLGGLDRNFTLIGNFKKNYSTLFFDTGDFLFLNKIAESKSKKDFLKANLIAEIYQSSGIDFILPGEIDLSAGAEFLKTSNLPFIACNLENPQFDYKRKQIITKNDLKFAVTGLLFYDSDENAKWKISDPILCINKLKWDEEYNLLIILAHGVQNLIIDFAKKLNKPSIIIMGHEGNLIKRPIKAGKSLLLEAGNRGKYLGLIKFFKPFDFKEGITDLSETVKILEENEWMQSELDNNLLIARKKGYLGKSEEFLAFFKKDINLYSELKTYIKKVSENKILLEKLPKLNKGGIANSIEPISSFIDPDPIIKEKIRNLIENEKK